MKSFFQKIFLTFFLLISVSQVFAQKEAKSNIRLNFFALFWQRASLQYEYQFKQNSLNATGNYTFGGDRIGVMGGLNYRYYLSDARTSLFIGGLANFSAYTEKVTAQIETNTPSPTPSLLQDYKFKPQIVLGALQGGFRWNILRIFNINARLAYGIPIPVQNTWQDTNGNNAQPVAVDKNFVEQRFKLFSSWDGEISFGVRF
jgi:hypothetical protein